MHRTTRSNRTYSSWAVVPCANPAFDFITSLCSAEREADHLLLQEFDNSEGPPPVPAPLNPPTPLLAPPAPTTSPPRIALSVTPPTPTTSPPSQMQKLKAASRVQAKKKRANVCNGRHTIPKKILDRFPPDGPSVSIDDASMEEAPVVRTGYVALNDPHNRREVYTLEQATGEGSELGFTLQRWNGSDPILIADKNDIVCAILAGHPNADDWPSLMQDAANALESGRVRCSLPSESLDHRRGVFATLRCGVSHGGGQTHPMNLKNSVENKIVLDELNEMECFTRIANFGSAVMMNRAPKLYAYYARTVDELHCKDPTLRRPFPGSIYCGVSYNLGPETVCYEHKDGGNLASGYCAVTPAGNFDSTKGGHLILWDCHLVIEFPAGSTILLPSAVVAHSNCSIQPGERHYSFTQYTAGALFRWVNNNHMPAVNFLKSLSAEERRVEEEKNQNRWKHGLSLLPRIERKKEGEVSLDK